MSEAETQEPHSPTPWTLGQSAEEPGVYLIGSEYVFFARVVDSPRHNGEANAKLIVRSVNAIPALIEAAESRIARGHNDTCQSQFAGPEYPCNCGHDQLTAAIAAAKE